MEVYDIWTLLGEFSTATWLFPGGLPLAGDIAYHVESAGPTVPLTLTAAELQCAAGQPWPPGAQMRGLLAANWLCPVASAACGLQRRLLVN